MLFSLLLLFPHTAVYGAQILTKTYSTAAFQSLSYLHVQTIFNFDNVFVLLHTKLQNNDISETNIMLLHWNCVANADVS